MAAIKFECGVCLDKVEEQNPNWINGGYVCKDCYNEEIKNLFEKALDFHSRDYPPAYGNHILRIEDYADLMGADFVRKFGTMEANRRVPLIYHRFCKHIKTGTLSDQCNGFLPPKNVAVPSTWFLICPDCERRSCPVCEEALDDTIEKSHHLAHCKGPPKEDKLEVEGQVRGKHFQICPNTECGLRAELYGGCNTLVCEACRGHFCFICGVAAHHDSGHWRAGGCPRFLQLDDPRRSYDPPPRAVAMGAQMAAYRNEPDTIVTDVSQGRVGPEIRYNKTVAVKSDTFLRQLPPYFMLNGLRTPKWIQWLWAHDPPRAGRIIINVQVSWPCNFHSGTFQRQTQLFAPLQPGETPMASHLRELFTQHPLLLRRLMKLNRLLYPHYEGIYNIPTPSWNTQYNREPSLSSVRSQLDGFQWTLVVKVDKLALRTQKWCLQSKTHVPVWAEDIMKDCEPGNGEFTFGQTFRAFVQIETLITKDLEVTAAQPHAEAVLTSPDSAQHLSVIYLDMMNWLSEDKARLGAIMKPLWDENRLYCFIKSDEARTATEMQFRNNRTAARCTQHSFWQPEGYDALLSFRIDAMIDFVADWSARQVGEARWATLALSEPDFEMEGHIYFWIKKSGCWNIEDVMVAGGTAATEANDWRVHDMVSSWAQLDHKVLIDVVEWGRKMHHADKEITPLPALPFTMESSSEEEPYEPEYLGHLCEQPEIAIPGHEVCRILRIPTAAFGEFLAADVTHTTHYPWMEQMCGARGWIQISISLDLDSVDDDEWDIVFAEWRAPRTHGNGGPNAENLHELMVYLLELFDVLPGGLLEFMRRQWLPLWRREGYHGVIDTDDEI